MKKILFLFGIVFLIIQAVSAYSLSMNLPTLAVVSFENHSSVRIPDLENMGFQCLENALLSSGMYTLADRLTVQNSLTEIGFSNSSGLVDPASAIQLGKMLGARYLVMGNVIDVSTKTTEFHGYNITTRRTAVSVTIGLRVIDAERGTVLFIDQASTRSENFPTESLSVRVSDDSLNIIENLIQQGIKSLVNRFNQNISILASKSTSPVQKVKIAVDSTPPGADVEIGGIFYGNTPCELQLENGRILEISISLSGYIPWIKKVEVSPNLKITAQLKELPQDTSSQSQVEVNIGIENVPEENQ